MAHVGNRRSWSEVQSLPACHQLAPVLAGALTRLCAEGDAAGSPPGRSAFDGTEPAPTSVSDYMVRLTKYAHCSPYVFICTAVLLNRFRLRTGVPITSHNVHRLLLSCFVLAAKTRDDVYYANKYYASIGGVTLQDMNKMEGVLLTVLDWDVHIDAQEYGLCVEHLQQLTGGRRAFCPPGARPSKAAQRFASSVEKSPDVDDLGSAA